MKRIISLMLVLAFCISLSSCMPNLKRFAVRFADGDKEISKEELSSEEYLAFLSKISRFSAHLSSSAYEELGYGSNFCISPIAVYSALAIACESSQGETRDQILNALGLSYEEVERFTEYLQFTANRKFYCENEGKEVETGHSMLSSSVWLDSSALYNLSAVKKLTGSYGCDIYAASYLSNEAQNMINQYVEYKTHDTVKSDLNFPYTADLSIICAYHIEEVWNRFGNELTLTLESHRFTNGDGSVSSVQLLKSEYEEGVAYRGAKYSSFVARTEHGFTLHFILPNKGYDIHDVFTQGIISQVISRNNFGAINEKEGTISYTRVLFPAFSASIGADISGMLANDFGVTDLFDAEKCDLSELLSSSAYLDKLTTQGAVKVGADGIYGTAHSYLPTNSVPENGEYTPVYHDFIINGAFGFLLTDEYGTILYSGVVDNVK